MFKKALTLVTYYQAREQDFLFGVRDFRNKTFETFKKIAPARFFVLYRARIAIFLTYIFLYKIHPIYNPPPAANFVGEKNESQKRGNGRNAK